MYMGVAKDNKGAIFHWQMIILSVNSVVAFLRTKNVIVGRNFHPSAWCVYVVVAVKDDTQGT